jgi:isopenicillin N synthase-like dioxygenase
VLKEKITSSKPQGEWIDAIAQPDEVINVGDMLSRHTNNKLNSIHQVVNPPRELWELQEFRFFYASC